MVKQGVNVAFSQYDLVLTQWAFVGPVLLFGDHLGFNQMSAEEKSLYTKTFYKVGRDLGESQRVVLLTAVKMKLRDASFFSIFFLRQ